MENFNAIKWFEDIRKTDIPIVGGKGANLGELTSTGAPVPPGFCVIAETYARFIKVNNLNTKILELLKGLDFEDTDELQKRTETIRDLIQKAPIPESIEKQIVDAYNELSVKTGLKDPDVAVRSSATAEDLPDASFAGQQDTYLHVIGAQSVVDHVRQCWASLWTARATYYRQKQNYDHFNVSLCAVVQKMVASEKSGVMFTANPITNDRSQMMINASWGLGEAVVSGTVSPDEFILDKESLAEIETTIADKKTMIVDRGKEGGTAAVPVEDYLGPAAVSQRCMTEEEVRNLAEAGKAIENHYGVPMDIEWGEDRETKKLYILQARPITTLKDAPQQAKKENEVMDKKALTVLVRGLAASPGIAHGQVVRIDSLKEIARVKKGDVLVTGMTNPDMVPAMKKACAVVTDEGGRTCHAAIVSRELGIPCIVGSKNGTQVLSEGMEVTVDATRGVVYRGNVNLSSDQDIHSPVGSPAASHSSAAPAEYAPITGTKIYMNLGDASIIGKYSHLPFDGIGLMRTEFIFSHIGVHPMYLLRTGRGDILINDICNAVTTVAQAIYPRPLVVRMSDFRTNEFRGLEGGDQVEPEENNPMIGWRGVSRYISPAYEEGFRLECKAIKKVRDEFGLINVWVMLPFVRTTWELKKVKEIMASEGLIQNKSFKIWIMAEVPAVVFQAEAFASLVDGFSIGSNDLTQLVMGVDRDSGILNNMGYFDERDPAVKNAIRTLIRAAHKQGITCSICGQGPSLYPDFAEFLVREGIDSMSVNPDTVAYTRRLVAGVEQRILLGSMRKLMERQD
jgi:pyruvate,water dikinase